MELRESMMKQEPEPYAVDLSNDGIFLWHRKPAKKWEFLGSVPLNSGNLREQLEDLSIIAKNTGAPSNHAIVRIPTAEVRTLIVDQVTYTATDMETRIIEALEDASKASVKTLAFDIARHDNDEKINIAWTHLAVIEQAATFVHLIGFEPTQYTTDLDASVFPRNPDLKPVDYPEASGVDTSAQPVEPPEPNTEPAPISNIEHTEPQKSDIEPIWFVVLIFIIALIIAAIYFWPDYNLSGIFGASFKADQRIFAIANDASTIHFV